MPVPRQKHNCRNSETETGFAIPGGRIMPTPLVDVEVAGEPGNVDLNEPRRYQHPNHQLLVLPLGSVGSLRRVYGKPFTGLVRGQQPAGEPWPTYGCRLPSGSPLLVVWAEREAGAQATNETALKSGRNTASVRCPSSTPATSSQTPFSLHRIQSNRSVPSSSGAAGSSSLSAQ
jgi:hypothetical protein